MAAVIEPKKPELFGLVGTKSEEPWGWLAWGNWPADEFLAAVKGAELDQWGQEYPHEPIERGWGRWTKAAPGDVVADVFYGEGWPIPLLNRPYTLVRLR